MRERTLARLAEATEEALAGVRDELGKMEEVVEGFGMLVFVVGGRVEGDEGVGETRARAGMDAREAVSGFGPGFA